jgi:hypothetical protein
MNETIFCACVDLASDVDSQFCLFENSTTFIAIRTLLLETEHTFQ